MRYLYKIIYKILYFEGVLNEIRIYLITELTKIFYHLSIYVVPPASQFTFSSSRAERFLVWSKTPFERDLRHFLRIAHFNLYFNRFHKYSFRAPEHSQHYSYSRWSSFKFFSVLLLSDSILLMTNLHFY